MREDKALYAHSLPDRPPGPQWEGLGPHLAAVAALAARFAAVFGAAAWGLAAGLLHDIGKASREFQRRIRGAAIGVDHSTAGAREAIRPDRYGPRFGKLLAFAIAGHHAGLADGAGHGGQTLATRLDPAAYPIPDYGRWRTCVGDLPDTAALAACAATLTPTEHPAFTVAFFTRMIFSTLVDADSLATEAFYNGGSAPARGGSLTDGHLRRVRAHTDAKRAAGEVNDLRAAILDHAVARAPLSPGLFSSATPWTRPPMRSRRERHHPRPLFRGCIATPAGVFPLLLRGAQNHFGRLRKDHKGGWQARPDPEAYPADKGLG